MFFRRSGLVAVCFFAFTLIVATGVSVRLPPDDLAKPTAGIERYAYLDRYGERFNITFENEWNLYDRLKLYDIPEFIQRAFILSEDKRFFDHGGVDWLARLSAIKQNLLAGKVVRGASTITEQVVRMIHPRSRTLWSRWVEGFEAYLLESKYTKPEILEFYLNQVPYKANRRGIVEAASYYFDRDISTLNEKEMMALAVLVRSPKWLDPKQYPENLELEIEDLAFRLADTDQEAKRLVKQRLILHRPELFHDLSHFIGFSKSNNAEYFSKDGVIHTTIDLDLQDKVQSIVDATLIRLTARNVTNGAALVVDHETSEILAWVVGFAGKAGKRFNKIDAVTVRRQPGSALKPLLYACAIDKGWTAATMLDDSPLEQSVGLGMHTYHNYGRDFYGPISLREALGNSLNIPAVKTIQFVGPAQFLSFLSELGIESLSGHPNVYGDGLALGNGELTLYELVQAYTVLARMGDFKPLSWIEGEHARIGGHRVLSEDIASLLADIMSDPAAREKEFGWDSILNFPHQTAVKTGTSSDYRDAWAIGFNDKYTVGVWIGNLDYAEMNEVTGSSGPAIVLRSVFNELNRHREVRSIYFSPNLTKLRVCIETGLLADESCEARDEWFVAGTQPRGLADLASNIRVRKPSQGLMLAMDPRIPDDKEYFEFALTARKDILSVRWFINDKYVATTRTPRFKWKLDRGTYTTRAEVFVAGREAPVTTQTVEYRVN